MPNPTDHVRIDMELPPNNSGPIVLSSRPAASRRTTDLGLPPLAPPHLGEEVAGGKPCPLLRRASRDHSFELLQNAVDDRLELGAQALRRVHAVDQAPEFL